jgi:regulation of enolase protein 1 (concanavalin A-like superfamily)
MNIRPILLTLCTLSAFAQTTPPGIFTSSGDIGAPARAGSTQFDATTGQYRITGSGANIWAKEDQLQFAWREMTGDFTVTATMRFLGKGADHRKAGIMLRQSTETDAAYVDVIVHGNGMPALQWRSRKGEDTNAFDLPLEEPGGFRIKLVRTGPKMHMFLAKEGAEPVRIGNTEVAFTGPILVGLAVCAHDPNASETVVFSDVSIDRPQAPPAAKAP